MDDRIKRMLYLTEFDNKRDKKLLSESVSALFESKQTEQQAFNILKSGGVDDKEASNLISQFKTADTARSKNQPLIPLMAKSYLEMGAGGLQNILTLYSTAGNMIEKNKIGVPVISKDGYVINNKTYKNFLGFSEYIHGLEGMSSGIEKLKGALEVETDEPPIFPDEKNGDRMDTGIQVFDGNDVGKCIKYGAGGLTGKQYGFCIGKPIPAQNMWQSYRDTKTSTFYYVVDSNRDLSDPLHIVVVDATEHGIELTDHSNQTGTIAEYDKDVKGYLNYLKSKGVPVDRIFVNKEKSPEEKAEQAKLGNSNPSLDWFKSLDYLEKSKYVGRGHLLSDEQFNYLWQFKDDNGGGYNLLAKYVDTGQPIPESQFNILVGEE